MGRERDQERERDAPPAPVALGSGTFIHLIAGRAPGILSQKWAVPCPDVVITSCCLKPLSLLCTTDNLNRIWYLEVGCCPNRHLNRVTLAMALGWGDREKQKRP